MQSEFQRDISNIEKKMFGVSRRQLKAFVILGLVSAIVVVEALFLPTWAFYVMAFITGLVLGIYPVLLLTDQWKKRKRQITLYFTYEERIYTSGQIRRYEANEFIQTNTVKETDSI